MLKNNNNIESVEVEVIEESKLDSSNSELNDAVNVITAEVIVPDKIKYTGEIVSSHDGFSYIHKVKRGYQTINTNGDVFVPEEFAVGTIVEFDELNEDAERSKESVKKFRTESAKAIEDSLVEIAKSERIFQLRKMSERNIYHVAAKNINPEEVLKASENMPFEKMLHLHEKFPGGEAPEQITNFFQAFLMTQFANLKSVGVSYSVKEDVNEEEESGKIEKAKKVYKENNMDGQVTSIQEAYETFRGIRKVFKMMHQNSLLHFDSVIPIYYLPDLLVTAPVFFIGGKQNIDDRTRDDDPLPDHAVCFFCDVVGTKEFSWLYQIYNRRTRPLKQFSGRDIMPVALIDIMKQAKDAFDYTVIAAPYHDIASKEWADPNWLRNLDPFLFGFKKGLPFMFLLGRWSGTGLFPLMCDMIADTIDHLRLNIEKLKNFSPDAYWYKGNRKGDHSDSLYDCLQKGGSGEHNSVLVPFAKEVIRSFEEGWLFDFLRGKKIPEVKEEVDVY